MTDEEQETHRLEALAAAWRAAEHAAALTATFQVLGSQLMACASSLQIAYGLMSPQERAQVDEVIAAQLRGQLGAVLTEIAARAHAANGRAGAVTCRRGMS